jgi:outer membrane lipoprotein SlyB
MQDKTVIGCVGICVIGGIEVAALVTGHDGTILAMVIGVIGSIVGGLCGYHLATE